MKKFETTISLRISKADADKYRVLAEKRGFSASKMLRKQVIQLLKAESL